MYYKQNEEYQVEATSQRSYFYLRKRITIPSISVLLVINIINIVVQSVLLSQPSTSTISNINSFYAVQTNAQTDVIAFLVVTAFVVVFLFVILAFGKIFLMNIYVFKS